VLASMPTLERLHVQGKRAGRMNDNLVVHAFHGIPRVVSMGAIERVGAVHARHSITTITLVDRDKIFDIVVAVESDKVGYHGPRHLGLHCVPATVGALASCDAHGQIFRKSISCVANHHRSIDRNGVGIGAHVVQEEGRLSHSTGIVGDGQTKAGTGHVLDAEFVRLSLDSCPGGGSKTTVIHVFVLSSNALELVSTGSLVRRDTSVEGGGLSVESRRVHIIERRRHLTVLTGTDCIPSRVPSSESVSTIEAGRDVFEGAVLTGAGHDRLAENDGSVRWDLPRKSAEVVLNFLLDLGRTVEGRLRVRVDHGRLLDGGRLGVALVAGQAQGEAQNKSHSYRGGNDYGECHETALPSFRWGGTDISFRRLVVVIFGQASFQLEGDVFEGSRGNGHGELEVAVSLCKEVIECESLCDRYEVSDGLKCREPSSQMTSEHYFTSP
jgi:hypothetical protein